MLYLKDNERLIEFKVKKAGHSINATQKVEKKDKYVAVNETGHYYEIKQVSRKDLFDPKKYNHTQYIIVTLNDQGKYTLTSKVNRTDVSLGDLLHNGDEILLDREFTYEKTCHQGFFGKLFNLKDNCYFTKCKLEKDEKEDWCHIVKYRKYVDSVTHNKKTKKAQKKKEKHSH